MLVWSMQRFRKLLVAQVVQKVCLAQNLDYEKCHALPSYPEEGSWDDKYCEWLRILFTYLYAILIRTFNKQFVRLLVFVSMILITITV